MLKDEFKHLTVEQHEEIHDVVKNYPFIGLDILNTEIKKINKRLNTLTAFLSLIVLILIIYTLIIYYRSLGENYKIVIFALIFGSLLPSILKNIWRLIINNIKKNNT